MSNLLKLRQGCNNEVVILCKYANKTVAKKYGFVNLWNLKKVE